MTTDNDTRAVEADLLEEQGHVEQAADLRLDIATTDVRAALYALFARLETARTRDDRMAAMMRSAAASRRAKQRGWTELVGQTMHIIARSEDPISALVGLAGSADDGAVRDAASAWLADHGARELRLRAVAQLGRVPRNPTCAVLEASTAQAIRSICIPDPGTHVWSSSMDGTLCAIDLATGAVEVIAPAIGEITHRRLATADGRVFAAVFSAYQPIVEEWHGRDRVRVHEGHAQLISVVECDGVHLVAAGHDPQVSVWNLATGERTALDVPEVITALAIRGDRVWVGGFDGKIRVYSIATRQIVETIEWFDSSVVAIVLDGDELIAAATHIRSTARGYGGHNGNTITALAVTRDRVISAGHDSVLRIWDRKNGARLHTVEGHSEWIYTVIPHPDGERVLSCAGDGTVRVVDLEHAVELGYDEINWNSVGFLVPLDEERMLVGGDESQTIECRGLRTPGWRREEPCGPLHVLGDLAIGGGSIIGGEPHVRSIADGSILRRFDTMKTVSCFAVRAGDRRVLGGCADGSIQIFSVDTGAVVGALLGHTGDVRGLQRHPDGDRVISMGFDNTFRVWSLATGTCLVTYKGHTEWPRQFVIVDERVVSWSLDHTVRIWDLATGGERRKLDTNTDFGARIPGTNRVVLSGYETGVLSILDVDRREIVQSVAAHTDAIIALDVTATHIATTSSDRSLAIWTHDLQLCARWNGRRPGAIAWLSPKRLALAESHGEVVVLEM